MWISKLLSSERKNETAEEGKVTLSSQNEWEAASSGCVRNISSYFPYGYSAKIPVGAEVILIPSSNGQAAVGCKSAASSLFEGEISIRSKGGAQIVLKNDGKVVINGSFIIDENGQVNSGG